MLNETAIKPVIAVIDDDENVGRSLARFLKASGFQSVIYRSASAFLADPQRRQFDCTIVDLQLDGVSGIDLREHLASAGEDTPMILMTAHDERELDRAALQAHDVVLMRKSDPGEALLAALGRVVHQYRHFEEGRRDGGSV